MVQFNLIVVVVRRTYYYYYVTKLWFRALKGQEKAHGRRYILMTPTALTAFILWNIPSKRRNIGAQKLGLQQ